MKSSRAPEIMGDASYVIMTSKSDKTTDNFFIVITLRLFTNQIQDDEVLASTGVQDFSKYRCDPKG